MKLACQVCNDTVDVLLGSKIPQDQAELERYIGHAVVCALVWHTIFECPTTRVTEEGPYVEDVPGQAPARH